MFSMSDDSSNKKKGKQATKGDAQIVKENAQTIEFYKKILIIVNVMFIAVHFIFYFITGLSHVSLILFVLSTAIAWYVWWFMRQVGTKKSTGSVTDLNLEGSISEYAKDIILAIVITQFASLLHRYCWWLLLVIPLYAIYKAIMLFFFSPYAQLGASDKKQDDDDQADGKRGGKRKLVRVARH
ncbi:unnamed protein product [Rotaria socialis]|uniref:Transmembrane protein 208 n=2 Tax=Rotaria socialis TaxID=392032 RepID=A0A817Y9F2_9BILA|nr:unnamed protein product [Rotaria socialis]CAF3375671.1 unnamed protein product [Rotaria socialis]CAF3461440.1 unnamed protein product [Rotaria socialis]CAF4265021.1 unnamed protein product [Rotaria socialis]CAF4283853.1 unnamed protein product [Rotaria socialis]